MFALALGAELIAPFPPRSLIAQPETGQPTAFLGPSTRHWLGTDGLGRDLWSRVVYGSRRSLLAGLTSVTLALVVGASAGALAGYAGGWTEALVMRATDGLLSFPGLLIALLVWTALGPGWPAVMVAVGIMNIPTFCRQVRAQMLVLREAEFVLACRALGATPWHILTRAVLPELVSPLVVLATLGLGTAILEVAGLSFLGIAGEIDEPEWGNMLREAKDHVRSSLWPALAPGVAISLTVIGFNLLGDGLRDALDPKLPR